MSQLNRDNEGVLSGVARVLKLPDAASLGQLQPSVLWGLTQRELLEAAKTLGLTKVSRLNKQALLARVWEALERAGAIAASPAAPATSAKTPGFSRAPVASAKAPVSSGPAARPAERPRNGASALEPVEGRGSASRADVRGQGRDGETRAAGDEAGARATGHKFEVGQFAPADLAKVLAAAQAEIPWSYGRDRLVAMPVDPARLFVYWEVTDEGLAKATASLGSNQRESWINLRVYDVTGRIFDGTNAHGYFDHRLERWDRQWFFHIGKPTSQVVVEIGVKSDEGYFVRVARSGRVEFPRSEPVDTVEPDWMTVHVSTGYAESVAGSGAGLAPSAGSSGEPPLFADNGGPGGGPPSVHDLVALVREEMWRGRSFLESSSSELLSRWQEWGFTELEGERHWTWSWEGESEVASWWSGPFSYPVEAPGLVREAYQGPARVFQVGPATHVVWGPWQVVVRGIDPSRQHKVVSRWEVYRSWTTDNWRSSLTEVRAGQPGSSEKMLGASERVGRGASELRLGGASERYWLGASELRLGGASERMFLGASQWMKKGASERRLGGASEWLFRGASERLIGGASEKRLGGASEWMLGGASERLGASERRLGGASERLGGASGQWPRENQDLAPPADQDNYAYPALPGGENGRRE